MKVLGSQIARAFRHRDFRFLWTGAFFSFIGNWIQTVAQGWLIYYLTHSEAALALVMFVRSLPYFVMGPLPGVFVDSFNKKTLLVLTQVFLSLTSLYLFFATKYHFVTYWQIVLCALVVGTTGAFEIPTRQSAVGSVVPVSYTHLTLPTICSV